MRLFILSAAVFPISTIGLMILTRDPSTNNFLSIFAILLSLWFANKSSKDLNELKNLVLNNKKVIKDVGHDIKEDMWDIKDESRLRVTNSIGGYKSGSIVDMIYPKNEDINQPSSFNRNKFIMDILLRGSDKNDKE